ncbi:MAG: cytochrome P450 [Balneolaceae bacterium]
MIRKYTLPEATISETAGFMSGVFIPTIAKGPIIRRPKAVAVGEKLDLDRRAIEIVQKLEERHGKGPLMLKVPVRKYAVILSPEHVHRVLNNSPEPFATATKEKKAALSHFEPKNALISHGEERAERRHFNEEVLESESPRHHMAEKFISVIDEEVTILLNDAEKNSGLDWYDFIEAWFRVVRRVVFGDHARDDRELTQMIAELRADANWAFLKPKNTELRDQFHDRVKKRLAKAEPGSLAALIDKIPGTEEAYPWQQVPQWLFAFDPACMVTFRTLALLSTHPEQAGHAFREIENDKTDLQVLPYLRACILDTTRLWPTTPLVLRETTTETEWETGIMPARTHIVIFAPYFHRDNRNLTYSDSFTPELWMRERDDIDWPLIPFSGGPAICPGRHIVLLLTSAMLAALFRKRRFFLKNPERLDPAQPLPSTLNNFSLEFDIRVRDKSAV